MSRDVAAVPEAVWSMVSDITRMGEWSPENEGAAWLAGATAPIVGASFRGTNRQGAKRWKTVATVTSAEPGRRFTFQVIAGRMRVAEWDYTFRTSPMGCLVTETWTDQRGRLATAIARRVTGVADRPTHNRAGMEVTLERLATAAEFAETSA